jgi:hypothetical protein
MAEKCGNEPAGQAAATKVPSTLLFEGETGRFPASAYCKLKYVKPEDRIVRVTLKNCQSPILQDSRPSVAICLHYGEIHSGCSTDNRTG